MWAWYLAGAALLALSWRFTGDLATAAFWGGLVVGNAGALYTWYFMYAWNKEPGE